MRTTQQRSKFPDDFKVSQEIIELAKARGWPNPQREFEAFRDYHLAHGSLFFDWEAAFRTWLRNAVKFNKASMQLPKSQRSSYVAPPEITEEQRRYNLAKVRELVAGIGKKP